LQIHYSIGAVLRFSAPITHFPPKPGV
jgi:hypothetical protein